MKYCRFILFILTLFLSLFAYTQNQQLKFKRIGTKEGLSDPNVNCILQDSRGFLWIGTRYGLNRYDGLKFKVFYSDPSDSGSLSNSYIQDIFEDSKGNIWISTSGGGFNKFDRKKNRFKQYTHQQNNPKSISTNNVNKILEDRTGNLWIATDDGVNLFNPETNDFIRFYHDKADLTTIGENNVITALVDSQGDIWFGTLNSGLNKFDRKDSTFICYQTDRKNIQSISGNRISAIFEDSKHQFWVGASSDGLNLFDRKSGKFSRYEKPSEASSLIGRNILCINEDDNGNLWIGSDNGGISIFNYKLQKLSNYTSDEIDDSSLSKNSVYSITKDYNGNIWLGLYGGGINLHKKSMNSFNHYKHTSSPNSLSNNLVLCIYEDRNENLWIGTDGGGLNYFDKKTGESHQFIHHQTGNSIVENYVLTLAEDKKDNLWIGTWAGGLSKLNIKTQKFTNFKQANNNSGLSSNNIYDIAVADDGKVWIGTFNGGLDLYNEQSKQFIHYRYNKKDSTSISSDNVFSILIDKTGKVWIGTFDGGVCLFEPGTNSFIRFNTENKKLINNTVAHIIQNKSGIIYACTLGGGLNYYDPSTHSFIPIESQNKFASEYIYAALEDLNGDLWVSTNKGISKYDPKNKTVKNYTVEDGLQDGEFKPHSAFITKSGMLYFGGVNGYNSFFPDQIIENKINSPIVLTDFQIFNKSVSIAQNEDDPSPLKQDISETKSIHLSYKQSYITLEYASLNFSSPDKNSYAYMLEGFDSDWNYVGSKNSATYMKLDPANYVFKVKSQNRSGEWSSQILKLDVIIVPPFWLKWWFKILLGLILISVPLGLLYLRIKRLRNQKRLLEKLVVERTQEIQSKNELLKDLNSTKDKLFSIISHDLRSPFSAILGFQDLLNENYEKYSDIERKEMLEQLQNTTKQIYTLVENLLNWARIQSDTIHYQPINLKVKEMIDEKLNLYKNIAETKKIKLSVQVSEELFAFADVDLLDTILRNLISNAIKFTHIGGTILVSASQNHKIIKISVMDSGIGMNQEQIDNLYNLEKTHSKHGTNGEKGSGLGLVLCKELVEKNNGTISVESEPDKGSTFSFTVPTTSTAG
ncbi:MAG TPA: two-component regulator propeller domain-containing protein [Prolixibacteraceae bacterium]|nr:two-component regulator propeller domain-containing protein [Prolixibacteraceae bacterium]